MSQNWEERLSSEFNWDVIFGKDSLAQKAIVDFIKQVRKRDMEALIEYLKESDSNNIYSLIKDYYEN